MGKVFDITDKLGFEEAPKLKIKNIEVTVKDDAPTMLKVIGILNRDDIQVDVFSEAYELLLSEEDRKRVEKLKLNFDDFKTFVKCAIAAVTGKDMDDIKSDSE